MSTDSETRDNIQKFLRNPVKNYLIYSLSKRLLKLSFISPARKEKLSRSIKKRDYRELYDRVGKLGRTAIRDHSPNFQNSVIDKRSKVLHQDWHVSLTRAVNGTYSGNLPKILLSLVTYNSESWLDGFFLSLLNQKFPLEKIDLKITDHGSDDKTVSAIETFFSEHKDKFASSELFERPNSGFGAGHDHNIKKSDAEFVLISNVDLVFGENSILAAVAAAAGDDADVACWELRQCPYEHPKYYDPVTLEASWCSHACILLRTAHYESVGGYDPDIFMYGEDVELSYRFRGAGFRLRYLPQVPVTHFVDFEEDSRRVHQLSGSLSADVLLQYRYLGKEDGDAAAENLKNAARVEKQDLRKTAFAKAIQQVTQKTSNYLETLAPKQRVPLLFDGENLDLRRDGFDVELDSLEKLSSLPKVSVVTRTHGPNVGVLTEAIVSVMNQTYGNTEHIIVEDRTEYAKKTVEKIRSTYSADIRYLNSDGPGRSSAGNAGLRAATGDYLLFLDNDDLLFADHIELLVRRLITSQDLAAAYSLAWEMPVFFSASGKYREGAPHTPELHRMPYSKERLSKYNFIPIQAILFRRELFDNLGGFREDIEYLEDWDLWKKYAEAGEFEFIPKTTSMYKVPGDPFFCRERAIAMQSGMDS